MFKPFWLTFFFIQDFRKIFVFNKRLYEKEKFNFNPIPYYHLKKDKKNPLNNLFYTLVFYKHEMFFYLYFGLNTLTKLTRIFHNILKFFLESE